MGIVRIHRYLRRAAGTHSIVLGAFSSIRAQPEPHFECDDRDINVDMRRCDCGHRGRCPRGLLTKRRFCVSKLRPAVQSVRCKRRSRDTSVEFLVSEPTAFLYFHVPADILQSFSRSAKVIVRVYRIIHRRAGRSRQRRTDRCAPRRYAANVACVPRYLNPQRMTENN